MHPDHYDVGGIRIEPNIVLSPMEGVTDLTFRRLIRHIGGVGLTVTEFIASKGLAQGSKRMEEMAAFDPDEHPVAIQLFGRDPEDMAEAARIVEGMGADICDINMGCPSKKVCAHSGGSALMREPELAQKIVQAVVNAVAIPVTVKMRSGFDDSNRNAPKIAYMCQEEGAQAVAIHWRTRADGYGGERHIDKIRETRELLQIPVLGNGDINDVASAKQMFEETGVHGVLVGRGAIRNPWLLLQITQWLRGEKPLVVNATERRRVMLSYFNGIQESLRHPKATLGRFKMLANFYTRGLPGGKVFRDLVLHSKTPEQAIEHVEAYFVRLRQSEAGNTDAFEGYQAPPYIRARRKATAI